MKIRRKRAESSDVVLPTPINGSDQLVLSKIKNSNVIPLKRVLFCKTLENKKVFFHLSRIFAFLTFFVILIVKSFVHIINKGLSTDQLTFVNFCCSYE
jgi:hypothetical protein